MLKDVSVQAPQSYLQGVFIGDGCVKQLILDGVSVDTMSDHSITVAGVTGGTIRRCVTSTPIKLMPLRILGGTEDGRAIMDHGR